MALTTEMAGVSTPSLITKHAAISTTTSRSCCRPLLLANTPAGACTVLARPAVRHLHGMDATAGERDGTQS